MAEFIKHCDYYDCDLETFDFVCPNCKLFVSDTTVWWNQYEINNGNPHEFNCPKCKTRLILSTDDDDDYDYKLTIS